MKHKETQDFISEMKIVNKMIQYLPADILEIYIIEMTNEIKTIASMEDSNYKNDYIMQIALFKSKFESEVRHRGDT